MKQLIQNLKNGDTILEEVPLPQIGRGDVLIQTRISLVSAGTEKMLVEFGKANLIQKARLQPEKVRMVWEKVKADGLFPTLGTVFNKLDQPIPLGYCNAGVVSAIGADIHDLQIGDRVASNGPHAEMVCVPRNLVAKIPDGVTDDEAAFTAIASIALQGIRLLNPTLGETIVVTGLGLVGLITAELLLINGCRVIGIDPDEARLKIAAEKGVITCNPTAGENPVRFAMNLTQQHGADGVIIAASSRSDELVSQAARMSRRRGRIILVGVVGLQLNRSEFYEKELSFQVSCSFGPGRYDDAYEQKGIDYPHGLVRWTENRNFQAVLQLLSTGKLDVNSLISERVPFAAYEKIYNRLGSSNTVASLLYYPEELSRQSTIRFPAKKFDSSNGIVGIIGAGNYTGKTLLPILKSVPIKYIASANGISGNALAKKFNISHSTTDYQQILDDPEVDLVIITTRHHLHAQMAMDALTAGKHVLVEKPLAIFDEELLKIEQSISTSYKTSLLVGFNRRFSPFSQKMKSLLGNSLMNIVITVNAGAIPAQSWVHDRAIGGGRLIGEACHFIDLMVFLSGSEVSEINAIPMGMNPAETTDSAHLLLRLKNGSTGAINYLSEGSKAYSKERVEVYSQGKTLILDNFRRLTGYGTPGFTQLQATQDKGHKEMIRRLLRFLKEGGEPLIPIDQILNVSRATLAISTSIRQHGWIDVR